MKHHFRIVLVAVLAALMLPTAAARAAQDGLDLLPADIQGVLTIDNLSRIYATLGVAQLRSERPEDFRFLTEELIEDVGIDLLDPAAMEAEGFDLERPMHVGIMTDPSAVIVLIPGKGHALEWARAKMEEQGVKFERHDRFAGVKVDGGADDEVACFERKGYMGIVVTDHDEGGSAMAVAGKLLKGAGRKTVESSGLYQKAMSKLPAESDARFYVGPELQSHMSTWGKSDKTLAEHGMSRDQMQSWYRKLGFDEMVAGVAMRLEPDGFVMDGYSWFGKNGAARDWLVVDNDPVAFLHRTPATPWLLSLMRVNAGAMWRALSPMFKDVHVEGKQPPVEDGLADFKDKTGIDLEADLIDQIDGNIGLLVDRAAIVGTDVLFLLQVRDPARFQGVVDKATALAREDLDKKAAKGGNAAQMQIVEDDIAGAKVYRVSMPMAELCYGIVGDHFVAASSVEHFRAVAEAGDTGFLDDLPNAQARAAAADPAGSVFYVDFRALSRDAQAILPMMGPKGTTISQVLAELSEMVTTSRVDDTGIVQATALTSTRPGIWKYLFGLLVSTTLQGVDVN